MKQNESEIADTLQKETVHLRQSSMRRQKSETTYKRGEESKDRQFRRGAKTEMTDKTQALEEDQREKRRTQIREKIDRNNEENQRRGG